MGLPTISPVDLPKEEIITTNKIDINYALNNILDETWYEMAYGPTIVNKDFFLSLKYNNNGNLNIYHVPYQENRGIDIQEVSYKRLNDGFENIFYDSTININLYNHMVLDYREINGYKVIVIKIKNEDNIWILSTNIDFIKTSEFGILIQKYKGGFKYYTYPSLLSYKSRLDNRNTQLSFYNEVADFNKQIQQSNFQRYMNIDWYLVSESINPEKSKNPIGVYSKFINYNMDYGTFEIKNIYKPIGTNPFLSIINAKIVNVDEYIGYEIDPQTGKKYKIINYIEQGPKNIKYLVIQDGDKISIYSNYIVIRIIKSIIDEIKKSYIIPDGNIWRDIDQDVLLDLQTYH
jgi:hypothetical protein